jgi:hypothetical protein
MRTEQDILAEALETAVDDIAFALDAVSFEFEVADSLNTNQYMIVLEGGDRIAYVTADSSFAYGVEVYVDICGVGQDGTECFDEGDLTVDEAIAYLTGVV